MRKQVAFIRPKPWPLANLKMAETIKAEFSDCDVDVIDIEPLILKNWWISGINLIHTIVLYGQDILARKKKFKEAFWRTKYVYKIAKQILQTNLSRKNYWFTFQMQSLFDCSLPDTPHFLYTDHTHLENLKYPGYDAKSLYKNWIDAECQIYQNATINFVRSTNIRKSLIEQYQQPAEKVIISYAGSNIESDNSIAAEKNYSNQNILFVGLDWERKGGPELIEAFKQVLDKFPKATLTIVGSNPKLQLPNCKIIGKVSSAELINFYNSASIFCMPTTNDPFGIVYLEAMQAGLPIIATNVGAIPDFIQNDWNGFLVEPGDVQGIANGLIKLLSSADLCRLFGKRNIDLIKERYSRQAVGQKIHKHITEYLTKEIYTL